MKIPYLLVIGDKEMEDNTVAVRTRTGEDLGVMSIEAFRERLQAEVLKCGRTVLSSGYRLLFTSRKRFQPA